MKKISFTPLWRKSFLLATFIISILFFSSGCKDEDEVGLKLLPPGDHLNTDFSDTATVSTMTQLEDSLRTDELSLQLLGSDDDPVFGVSVASIYTQVNLEGTPTFGFQPVADSLILCLAYDGYYGDTTSLQTFNVYHLTENMFIDSSYYSSRTFSHDATSIGTLVAAPRPNSKLYLDTDSIALTPQIRIPLSLALADSILALNGTSTLASNIAWLAYFKGLYIEASPVNNMGAISYFNFFKLSSKLSLYFHDTSSTSKNYDFSLLGARLNSFSHNYGSSPVGLQLGNSSIGDSVNYIQSMCGVKTKISFPFLKHFLDSGSILLNRAELTISTGTVTIPYSLPARVYIVTPNDNGEMVFPIDYYESASYFGGELNSTSDGYVFNIARHLQRYLDGTVSNADFYLIIAGSGVEGDRAIIKSGSNPISKMKLSLFYTKLY